MDLSLAISSITTEIKELHEFFENWFSGKLDKSKLSRVKVVLSSEFEIISPGGMLNNRQFIFDVVENAYNTGNIRIWTENIKIKQISDNLYLATYHELQLRENQVPDKQTSRISTAIFRYNGLTPNNFEWVHVHETWIQTTSS